MNNIIQITQSTPEALAELINNSVKNMLEDFKKEFQSNTPDELLTREQAYQFLQIDSATLWSWTKKGKVLAYGIGSRRYYKKSELLSSLIPLKTVA
ncbi:Helix-turn-helix domain protein [compost metagenome]